ncbi:MAG TPA: ribosome biogenesis GTPase Der [Kofleriaceae bacterium]|nr:ribosome biogenesis GTPase Der [Kofleriaceae bacterium]
MTRVPLVAIVGRPNVGKSTLFNRLVGGRPALVHDTPGLTRDRRYGEADYFGRALRVVDTGGLDPDAAREVVGAGIHRQAMRAIDEADAVLLVVDGRAGISSIDHALARQLRAIGKPMFLAINKIDHPTADHLAHDFHELGIDHAYPISAAHGRGVDPLLEAIADALVPPPEPHAEPEVPDDELAEAEPPEAGPLRVAFIGRPNAGKSSLTNRLLGDERSLVHHVAGTTTDPVDTPFSRDGRDYVLIDTAGIRRKAKVDADVEKIAVSMALGQIERADVVVLVIDAELGPAEQDARIAGKVEEAGRALVIALNKSDLLHGDARKAALREQLAETMHFMPWAPTVLLSAQRGDGVDKLLDVVDRAAAEHRRRIQTAQLNRFFGEVIEEMPPPLHHGRAVRIHYITQAGTRPPTFVLWANHPDGLAPSYKRFIANRLRDSYGFRGTPIHVVVKARKDRHK